MTESASDDVETVDSFLAKMGISPEGREAIEAAGRAFEEQAGYEPPPHSITVPSPQPHSGQPPAAGIAPLTKTRIRGKPKRLIEQLEDINPSQVQFDPFIGDSTQYPTGNKGVQAVLEAELYVQAAANSILSAVSAIAGAQEGVQVARAQTQERALAAGEMLRGLEENLAHVQQKLAELAPEQRSDAGSDTEQSTLRTLYHRDEVVLRNNIRLVRSLNGFDELDMAVTDFSEWAGALHDQTEAANLWGLARNRKRRRRWRQLRFGAASLALPAVALIVDQAFGFTWALAGSALFSLCVVVAGHFVDTRLKRRRIRSQIASLVTAVRESGKAVERLKYRELQFTSLQALHGLPPLSLVPLTLLDPVSP